jgi:SAM-dependent methyltransferase
MSKWDQPYRTDTYVYGSAPNDYLTANAHHLPFGNVLCRGDIEGRDGVWLAEQGWQVTAVDISPVGLTKARDLAVQRGLPADKFVTVVADLADYELGHHQPNQIGRHGGHPRPDLTPPEAVRAITAL